MGHDNVADPVQRGESGNDVLRDRCVRFGKAECPNKSFDWLIGKDIGCGKIFLHDIHLLWLFNTFIPVLPENLTRPDCGRAAEKARSQSRI
jgi:hypothetical protein